MSQTILAESGSPVPSCQPGYAEAAAAPPGRCTASLTRSEGQRRGVTSGGRAQTCRLHVRYVRCAPCLPCCWRSRRRAARARARSCSELQGTQPAGQRARARGRRRRPVPDAAQRHRQAGDREGLRGRALPALPAEPRGRGEHPLSLQVRERGPLRAHAASRPRPTPRRPPKWQAVSRDGTYRWFDHRIHSMEKGTPPQVKDESMRTKIFDWDVPMTVGGAPVNARRHARVGARAIRRPGCSTGLIVGDRGSRRAAARGARARC